MRRTAATTLMALTGLIAFGGLAASVHAQDAASAPSTVAWKTDLDQARKVSERTGKPMLLVFRADWCTHCERFEKKTLGNSTMAQYINRGFVPVSMDFDKRKKEAEVLEVEALPCTVVLSPQADLLGRLVGAKPPKDLWEALQDAKDEHVRVRQARFAASGENPAR